MKVQRVERNLGLFKGFSHFGLRDLTITLLESTVHLSVQKKHIKYSVPEFTVLNHADS